MIVVDVNVFLYSLVEGERSEAALRVFEADPKWFAPSLFQYELINILATWNRKGIMGILACQKVWREAEALMSGKLVEADPKAVLDISLNHQITAYDAQYIQIAAARKLHLVTEDHELLRKFPRTAVSTTDFLKLKSGN